MKIKTYARIAAGAAVVLCLGTQVQASGSGTADNNMLQELKRMIEQQQAQLDKQAAEIAALKEKLSGTTEALATKADKEALKDTDKMVTSSYSNVNLSLYGQINRALMYVNNGDTSKWYSVDNTNSQSRLGLLASVDTASGWLVGGRIEYGIVSNGSSDVSQLNTTNATSDNFKLRWAEISFKHDAYGKLSLGKGDSASNNTAEIDLSGTAVATYAAIPDMAGSSLWYQGATDTLSSRKIKNVYNDFDGLSRTDRVRYDTPSFAGFQASASASSGDAFDGSLWYNRDFNGTKVAAGFGAANPGDIMPGVDVNYSTSASILFPMGFNATLSYGYQDLSDDSHDNPSNWWGKLGYRTTFYQGSSTAFSVDYGETADLQNNGDKAKVFSLAAVHNIEDWGTEFYAVWRTHQLDTDSSTDYDDINVFMTGARLKF